MLPEFIFSVGNSMQDLSCDCFNFINGANNGNTAATTTAKTDINSIQQQQQHNTIQNNGSNLETNKFEDSLLRGIKLEDVQDNNVNECCEFFTTRNDGQQINETIKTELRTTDQWTLAHTAFSSNETPAINSQSQQNKILSRQTPTTFQQQQQQQQQHHHQLLLQSSDDPLICHGADNDHSVELKHLLTAAVSSKEQKQHQQQRQKKLLTTSVIEHGVGTLHNRPQNGCSSLTKQQLKVKAGLMSAANQQQKRQEALATAASSPQNVLIKTKQKTKKKTQTAFNANSSFTTSSNGSNALKLRFHHQALPPEYLSHYEATQRRLSQVGALSTRNTSSPVTSTNTSAVKLAQTAKLPPPKSSHENVRSWLQKIAEIQRAAQQQQQHQQAKEQQKLATATVSSKHETTQTPPISHLQRTTAENDFNNNHQTCRMLVTHNPTQTSITTPSISCLPKHINPTQMTKTTTTAKTNRLVNYADLPYMGEITLNNSKPRRGRKPKKADICHLIYKNYGNTIFTDTTQLKTALTTRQGAELKAIETSTAWNDQPLNLCMRDYQKFMDLYSISSEEDGNYVDAGDEDASESISEESNSNFITTMLADALNDSMLATNMNTVMQNVKDDSSISLLNPVKVYYQKLLESGMLMKQNNDDTLPATFAGLPIETIEKDNQIALKIPIPSGFFVLPKEEPKQSSNTPVPMESTPLLEPPEPISTPSSIKSEQSYTTTTNSSNIGSVPQKRKRSAIFIPPMPAENTTNPANEVSICKFKFTGGAKPTLQEKKMLSVDSDGNYRYYSGTGDKSTRGYEFFPRECVQQSGGFLPGINGISNEKVSIDIPPPSADLSNELLQIPDSPNATLLLPMTTATTCAVAPTTVSLLDCTANSNLHSSLSNNRRDDKNRTATPYDTKSTQTITAPTSSTQHRSKKRSLTSTRSASTQREKLEKTFKEKGFLIQTQQLESAEGATYCKFRQLKKFTRYLFRNWKDYLPDGQVPQNQIGEVAAGQQAAFENFLAGNCFTEEHCSKNMTATEAIDHRNCNTETENTLNNCHMKNV